MSSRDRNLLFSEYDLGGNLRAFVEKIPQDVDAIPEQQFLISSDDEILRSLVAHKTLTPLSLHEDHATMQQSETKIDVAGWRDRDWGYGRDGPLLIPGTNVTISIPFTGDPQLWKCKTSTWTTVLPHGEIRSGRGGAAGELILSFSRPHDESPDAFKRMYDSELSTIRQYLSWSRTEIEAFNANLEKNIRPAIHARRERLKKHSGIADLLGIPIKTREGAPPVKPIRVEPRIVVPLPSVPKSGLKPEPGILDNLYESILSIIRHEGRTFETTPKTYRVHDEEELRDIMLAHLNGHFQGAAGGETFRRSGKTDIRIEDNNRAAFVGECKVWRGQSELTRAIDQLTSYLTWRDCKAAVIIFNKDVKRFSELLEKVPEILGAHPHFIEMSKSTESGEWQCILRSKEDEGRRIRVRTFLFNLFSE